MQAVCYNCFRYVSGSGPCPYCGYDPKPDEGKYRIALPPGTPLAKRYVLGRVLGQGGFGMTYVALDSQTRARVAIKEYLPKEFVSREADGTSLLLDSSEQREDFEYGKQQFLAEARTLAEFVGGEHIVSIHGYFEENGTAYFAMEYLEGRNLKQYMEDHGGPLPVHEANRILLPVMEALDWIHSKGIVHRDISPDNIVIKKDGAAKLIDFGAARQSTGEKSKSLDVVLKHGFAPMEQYSRRGRQGPFTDVYAMAATYYYAITGKVPPDAVDRMSEDELILPSALGVKIRKSTEQVLLKALAVNAPERYQRMSEFYSALLETMPLPFSPEAGEENRAKEKQEMAYREACRLMETSKTEAEYRAVIRQFEKLQGYKDSRDRITQCGDAITSIKEEQRRQKEEEAKRRAEEKEKKRAAKADTQAEKKPVNDVGVPKKKKPAALIAAVLAIAILAGIVFGSGVLKKSPAISEPDISAQSTASAEATPEVQEPAETPEPEPEPEPEEPDPLKDYKTVGSVVTFGAYEQDNDFTNGKEPIEWIVLDVQDGRSLLVSEYALDCGHYNPSRNAVTWETCSLRTWLNGTFLKEAFSETEQTVIPTVVVSADKNPAYDTDPGRDTEDRVFLLSVPEAEKYWSSYTLRRCKPTAYAIGKGCFVDKKEAQEKGYTYWWLRTPGSSSDTAVCVHSNGPLKSEGSPVYWTNDAIRPALWVDWDKLALTTVGSVVTFGAYEQDNDEENGKEPIEWIVLDVQDGKSLVISKYALDCQPYNTEYIAVTWETCSLRTWLNGTFLKKAFSAEEQARIPTVTVTDDKNPVYGTDPGKNTQDRVFLLSIPEAEKYFASDQERQCKPTAYAVGLRALCWWWLRSPGDSSNSAAIVLDEGPAFVGGRRVSIQNCAVRPALWIDLIA